MSELTIGLRLLIIAVLAGAIGYERERHGRAAGFRTHTLVGIGSCLVMMTGIYLTEVMEGRVALDPTRMAAQVISGIGFLGAGTILRFRASVRGLTTAASLWAIAGIGLAVGAGFVSGALMAAGLVVILLFGFARLERTMRRDVYQTLVVEGKTDGDNLAKIRAVLGEYEVEIRDFDVSKADTPDMSIMEFSVKLMTTRSLTELVKRVSRLDHVKEAHWL